MMAHKCTQCGREFQDGSNVILKGCPSCGGKKFLYIQPQDMHKDVLEEKSIKQIAEETKEQFLEVKDDRKRPETAHTPPNVWRCMTELKVSRSSTPPVPMNSIWKN